MIHVEGFTQRKCGVNALNVTLHNKKSLQWKKVKSLYKLTIKHISIESVQ